MLSLDDLGFSEHGQAEKVAILVGPNGSGKSTILLDIARRYRSRRNVAIVCNTPHDRFSGLRGIKRISVGRSSQSPKIIAKQSVAKALNSGSEFYQISSILKHCGYGPRFGFRIERSERYGLSLDELAEVVVHEDPEDLRIGQSVPRDDDDLRRTLAFLARHFPERPIWIDATGSILEFSVAREFSSVLAYESQLRNWRVITGISVYLERAEDGEEIEMHHASSGQLALISSLLFLITNIGENPLIIIDEPENSLHPNWQREYVEKILAAMSYRGASIIIATHAPLIVTGALADSPDLVSVYEIREGSPRKISLEVSHAPNSIEEILWRAFDVVTPANHFVSEQIVAAVSRFEEKEIDKQEVLSLISSLDNESFDAKQKRFFSAVRQLVDKVEMARDGSPDGDSSEGDRSERDV